MFFYFIFAPSPCLLFEQCDTHTNMAGTVARQMIESNGQSLVLGSEPDARQRVRRRDVDAAMLALMMWPRKCLRLLQFNSVPVRTFPMLRSLTVLSLNDCTSFTKLHKAVGDLTELRVLSVRGCSLRKLPDSVTRLTKLKVLDCTNNVLTELPEGIGKLWRLTTLRVAHNYITELPDSTVSLSNLRVLDVHCNWLRVLPDGLGDKQPFLSEISVAQNFWLRVRNRSVVPIISVSLI